MPCSNEDVFCKAFKSQKSNAFIIQKHKLKFFFKDLEILSFVI